jgi:hypothetical protein
VICNEPYGNNDEKFGMEIDHKHTSDHLEDLGVNWRIILKFITGK